MPGRYHQRPEELSARVNARAKDIVRHSRGRFAADEPVDRRRGLPRGPPSKHRQTRRMRDPMQGIRDMRLWGARTGRGNCVSESFKQGGRCSSLRSVHCSRHRWWWVKLDSVDCTVGRITEVYSSTFVQEDRRYFKASRSNATELRPRNTGPRQSQIHKWLIAASRARSTLRPLNSESLAKIGCRTFSTGRRTVFDRLASN